jgi:hypothetical protein
MAYTQNTDGSAYWQKVFFIMAQIEVEIAKQTMQPAPTMEIHDRKPVKQQLVYIVSTKDKFDGDPDIRAGVISLAHLKIAAQRISERSHTLASDEEISVYLDAHARDKKTADSLAQHGRNTVVFAPKPVA